MVDESQEASRFSWRAAAASAATTLLGTVALLNLDGQLGPLSFTLRRAVALATLSAVIVFGAAALREPRTWGCIAVIVALAVAAMAIVARAPSVTLGLATFAAALAAIEIWSRSRPDVLSIAGGLVPPCPSYAALRFTIDLVPQSGAIGAAVTRLANLYVNRVRGFDGELSFTALGGPAISLAVLYLLWGWRRTGGATRLAAALAIPLGWFALLPVVTPDVAAGPLTAFSRGAWHGLFWLGITAVVDAMLVPRHPSPPAGRSPAGRPIALIAAWFAAAFAGVCLVGTGAIGPPTARTIRVHNRGGLDWDRPVFGRFGAFTGGMFGTWPVYCRAEGYDFGVVDENTVEAVDLPGVQTLVLINSPKLWDERQRRTIYDFIARGGSLLVLGDHTDVFGLMRGFNSLLGPLGIRFRFDSAYKARETWRGCQAAAPDAVCWGWGGENPGVAVGASLELSGSARPLLVRR